jgi:hypothetical protein
MEYGDVRKVNERRHLEQSCLHSTYSTFKNFAFTVLNETCCRRTIEYFINTAEKSKDDRLKYPQISLDIQGVNYLP